MESKINLPRDGREYLYLTFSPLPDGCTVDVQVPGDVTWHPVDLSGPVPKILLNGPGCGQLSGSVLVSESGTARFRVNSTPEVIPRPIGQIRLVS